MGISEDIVWDVAKEFEKRGWLTEKAREHWDAKHICLVTINDISDEAFGYSILLLQ